MNNIINEIFILISWYKNLDKNFNAIDNLVHARKKLSCLLLEHAIETGNKVKEFEQSYAIRKISLAKSKQKYIDTGNNMATSENLSIIEMSEQITQEKENEGSYKANKLIFDSVNKCLDSMATHINYLRDEYKKANYTQEV